MTLSESTNNVSMNFKICRQLIHEDFRKVLTQQPHGKISEYYAGIGQHYGTDE